MDSKKIKIFDSEYRFCLVLWETEPIKSRELSEICTERLGWSKTNDLYRY